MIDGGGCRQAAPRTQSLASFTFHRLLPPTFLATNTIRTTPKFFVPPPPRVITEDPYETSLDVIEAELWDQLYAFQWYPTKFADDETTFGVVQDKA